MIFDKKINGYFNIFSYLCSDKCRRRINHRSLNVTNIRNDIVNRLILNGLIKRVQSPPAPQNPYSHSFIKRRVAICVLRGLEKQ